MRAIVACEAVYGLIPRSNINIGYRISSEWHAQSTPDLLLSLRRCRHRKRGGRSCRRSWCRVRHVLFLFL